MLQVVCSRNHKHICDGSCDDPDCIAKHKPTIACVCGECEKLRALLRDARPLADPESPEGLQWMLDVRAALYMTDNA